MNVVVMIQGREAIPVRAIPLLTDWNFMFPDELVDVLSEDEESRSFIRETPLQAWRIDDTKVRLIPARSWESWTKRQLDALQEEINASGASEEIGYQRWRDESLELFPVGVFVWQDEFESFHRTNWNQQASGLWYSWSTDDKGYRLVSEKELAESEEFNEMESELRNYIRECQKKLNQWRDLDFSPFITPFMLAVVMEGFEPQSTISSLVPEPSPAQVVMDSASFLMDWTLIKPQRFQGYGKPLYDLLKAAHAIRQPKPSARDVLDKWKEKPPPDVSEVTDNGLKYYDARGNTKPADLRAIRKAIGRMTN